MQSGTVPDDVRRFVLTSIPSVPYAEAVLLLRRSAGEALSSGEVARALYVGERAALELLGLGVETGVLHRDETGYRYQPRDEALARAWDRFAHCYTTQLIVVTQLIHGTSQKSAQLFADAFKLKRET
ncbi:hypothetical protein [Roseateles sp.]|uniref:hypothetical protein n=1 Tax=Roseateles sp. TaxID=1971397 RepID=UPI002E011B86|nr:hypothetical protein [Roseateles sp.]